MTNNSIIISDVEYRYTNISYLDLLRDDTCYDKNGVINFRYVNPKTKEVGNHQIKCTVGINHNGYHDNIKLDEDYGLLKANTCYKLLGIELDDISNQDREVYDNGMYLRGQYVYDEVSKTTYEPKYLVCIQLPIVAQYEVPSTFTKVNQKNLESLTKTQQYECIVIFAPYPLFPVLATVLIGKYNKITFKSFNLPRFKNCRSYDFCPSAKDPEYNFTIKYDTAFYYNMNIYIPTVELM